MFSDRVRRNLFALAPYFTACLFIGFFFYWGERVSYLLTWKEENSLFLFDNLFLSTFYARPIGIIHLADAFLVQFNFYPYLGAGIITLLTFALYLLSKNIFKIFLGESSLFLALIPVGASLFIFGSTKFFYSEILCVLIGLVIILLLLKIITCKFSLRISWFEKTKPAIFFSSFGILFFIGISCLYFCSKSIAQEQLTAKIEVLAEEENWNEGFSVLDNYWSKKHDEWTSEEWTLCNYTKLMSAMTYNLPERFPAYKPENRFCVLFPYSVTKIPDIHSIFWSDFYFGLGMFPLSRLSASCIAEINGLHLNTLKRIYLCNLVLGDTLVNKRYAYLFSKTLFHKDFSQKYKANSAYIQEKQKLSASQFFYEEELIDFRVSRFAESSLNNRYAFEYAMMAVLYNAKDVEILANNMIYLKRFGYQHIPRFFEEALLTSLHYGEDPDMTREKVLNHDFYGFKIREATLNRCDAFLRSLALYQSGRITMENLWEKFGDSFWIYYLLGEPAI